MKRITPSIFSSPQGGFTLMEALVAMTLLSLCMSMVISHVMMMQREYYRDMMRTRVNSNLRSALDIMAMNIRQAGESLPSGFPAIELIDGDADNVPDILVLRRNRAAEVLTLCQAVSSGATQVKVSLSDLSNSACVNANVQVSHASFEDVRTEDGGTSSVFLYDTSSESGEFLDYSGGGYSGNQYYLDIEATSQAFSAFTTSIYLLEEFQFQLDPDEEIFQLIINEDDESILSVAFDVTDFRAQLEMSDGAVLTTLAPDNEDYDWKEIRKVQLTLTGESSYKGKPFETSLTAEYFPRNVLSYDG